MNRVLICAGESSANAIALALHQANPGLVYEAVENGIDAISRFAAFSPQSVVVDGRIDGRGGLRVAWALAQHRSVPTTLLVAPADVDEVIEGAHKRRLSGTRVLPWSGQGSPPAGLGDQFVANESPPSLRPELDAIADEPADVVLLLGSAGTPHLLPSMIPRLSPQGIPLVIAVHHNARLAPSFRGWISRLAGIEASPLDMPGQGPLPRLGVATAKSGVDDLQPRMSDALDGIVERGLRALVVVVSGMEFDATDAVRRTVERGGRVVALRPSRCSLPGMTKALLDANLAPALCSVRELTLIVERATRGYPARCAS